MQIIKDFLQNNILNNPSLKEVNTDKIEIKTKNETLLEIDGEVKKFTHANFNIIKESLLLCP